MKYRGRHRVGNTPAPTFAGSVRDPRDPEGFAWSVRNMTEAARDLAAVFTMSPAGRSAVAEAIEFDEKVAAISAVLGVPDGPIRWEIISRAARGEWSLSEMADIMFIEVSSGVER